MNFSLEMTTKEVVIAHRNDGDRIYKRAVSTPTIAQKPKPTPTPTPKPPPKIIEEEEEEEEEEEPE
jgi:hypothetical protein